MRVEIEDMLFREFQKITSPLGVGDVVASEAAQRCIAALPDTVQPLEWEAGQFKCNDRQIYTSRAFSPFGTYYAFERIWHGPAIVVAHGLDESDCQKRASDDYTRRILSAFGITEGEM